MDTKYPCKKLLDSLLQGYFAFFNHSTELICRN